MVDAVDAPPQKMRDGHAPKNHACGFMAVNVNLARRPRPILNGTIPKRSRSGFRKKYGISISRKDPEWIHTVNIYIRSGYGSLDMDQGYIWICLDIDPFFGSGSNLN